MKRLWLRRSWFLRRGQGGQCCGGKCAKGQTEVLIHSSLLNRTVYLAPGARYTVLFNRLEWIKTSVWPLAHFPPQHWPPCPLLRNQLRRNHNLFMPRGPRNVECP